MFDTDRPLGAALVAVGAASTAAALSIGGWDGEWGPRTVPLLAAVTLVLSGIAVARSPSSPPPLPPSTARPPRAVEGEPVATPPTPGTEATGGEGGVAWLLALAVLYVLLVDRVGYLVATALAAPAAFALFGVRRPLPLIAAALVVPLALHLAFFRVLGVFPPLGAWFDLTDLLPL